MKTDAKDIFNNLMDVAREYILIMDDDMVTLEVVGFMDYLAKTIGIDVPISKLDDGSVCETKVDDEILSQVLYNMLPVYTKGDKDKLSLLTPMVNYITKDKKYGTKDLSDRYQEIKHEEDMRDLKRFLGRTSKYSSLFEQGFSLEQVYNGFNQYYGFTDDDGEYRYASEYVYSSEDSENKSPLEQEIEEEFYAMAYAYAKSGRKDMMPEILEDKVEEMRTK